MTTERGGWISTLTPSTAERQSSTTTCRCGQELDVCTRDHRTHCPRCGATIAGAADRH